MKSRVSRESAKPGPPQSRLQARPAILENPVGHTESAALSNGLAPSIVHKVVNSPGESLDSRTRGFFEKRFHQDFSHVRIHADPEAAESARAVRARAYTVGNHVAFGPGNFSLGTREGTALLAHELAHTVQQSPGGAALIQTGSFRMSQPEDAAERQADATAAHVAGWSHGPTGNAVRSPALSRAPELCLQRQPKANAPDTGLKRLEKTVDEAAKQAAEKVQGGGKDKPGGHIPTGPELRHVPDPAKPPKPKTHVPPEDLRPDPREKSPVKPADPVPDTKKTPPVPDPGKREMQVAEGVAVQSGPAQAGMAVQGALQDKSYVPGKVYEFFDSFKAQFGILQPTYALQYSHLQPVKPIAGTAASPLPPPDTMQASATFSPVVITKGNLTISPQIGVAAAVGWDGSGAPKQPGSSGTHGQVLGVVNLQVDYKLDDNFSITGSVGDQRGLDVGPEGVKGTNAVTGSVLGTLHF
jgi:hypothetical protein